MTIQEGPSGLKTNVLRHPTKEELLATQNQFLEAEEGTIVNRVGRKGFQ